MDRATESNARSVRRRSAYGVHYPDTLKEFVQADQFQQTTQYGESFGPDTTWCTTIIFH